MDGWLITAMVFGLLAIGATAIWRTAKKNLTRLTTAEDGSVSDSRSSAYARDLRNTVVTFKRAMIMLWIFTGVLVAWSSIH